MPPSAAVCDAPDIATGDTKGVGDALMYFSAGCSLANLPHHVIGEHRRVVSLSFLASVASHVGIVLVRRTPMEVGQSVVRRVAVSVKRLMAIWAKPYECFQHEPVDMSRMVLPISCQDYDLAPVLVVCAGLELAPFAERAPSVVETRPDGAVVSGAVVWEPRDLTHLHAFHLITHGPVLRPLKRRIACAF